MALNLANPAVEQDVVQLARERGETVDEFLRAVVIEYKSDRLANPSRPTAAEIRELVRSFPPATLDYSLSEDEILGYGPNGFGE